MAAHRTVRLRPLTRSERRVLEGKLRDLSLSARIHHPCRFDVATGPRTHRGGDRPLKSAGGGAHDGSARAPS
jgi:hypothetical protein